MSNNPENNTEIDNQNQADNLNVKQQEQEPEAKKDNSKEFNFAELRKAKELSDKKAQQLEARLKAIEESKLQEQGKWEELAKKREEELRNYQSEVEKIKRENVLQSLIFKMQIDPKFSKLAKLELSELEFDSKSGEFLGTDEAINNFKSTYPEAFKAQVAGNVGLNNTTGQNSGNRTYKSSELANHDFYQKNEQDILKAFNENRIDHNS